MAVTLQQLNDAEADTQTLEDVINGAPDRANPGQAAGTVTTRLGRVIKTLSKAILDIFVPSGAWSSSTTYTAGQIVTYYGSSYVAVQSSNTNHIPENNTTWWQLLAAKGDTGSTGLPGDTGATGPAGSAYTAEDAVLTPETGWGFSSAVLRRHGRTVTLHLEGVASTGATGVLATLPLDWEPSEARFTYLGTFTDGSAGLTYIARFSLTLSGGVPSYGMLSIQSIFNPTIGPLPTLASGDSFTLDLAYTLPAA